MISPSAAKKLRRRLDGKDPVQAVRELIEECDRALARAKKANAASRALPRPEVPGQSRVSRKGERNKIAAEIRAQVMERSGGTCEFCHREGFVLEWHHIFGAGDRTHKESVENTAAICADCHHRGWAKNSPETFRQAKAWAALYFFGEAFREIEHREALAAASPTNKHRRSA
jgi:hypothetical protein